MKVFVYGTLKWEMSGEHMFSSSKRFGEATSKEEYFMGGGGFPRAIKKGSFPHYEVEKYYGRVRGEVYEVDEELLERLDYYEGYPHFYNRFEIPITLEGGEETMAWMYHAKEAAHVLGQQSCPFVAPDSNGELVWPDNLERN